MPLNDNLYETLFPGDDADDDVGIFSLNEIYSHLNFDSMSNYFDLKEYNNMSRNFTDNQLHILHFNIRSLPINLTKVEALLDSSNIEPNVMVFSETWFDSSNKDTISFTGYQSFHVVRDNRTHGGVSIYVRDNLEAELLTEFSYINLEIETCTVKLRLNNETYIICGIYRPQSKHEHINEFRKEIAPILNNKLFKKSKCVITGDFNINLLEHSEHRPTNEFLNLMQTYNYLPLITRPTRFAIGQQAGAPSLLDHFYIDFTAPLVSGILHHDITDHLPIFINVALPSPISEKSTLKYREFSRVNNDLFTRKLCEVIWEDILDPNKTLNENFNSFIHTFRSIYNACFPIKTKNISPRRKRNPWVTSGIITSIKKKNNLFKNFKLGLVSEHEYKIYRNTFNSLIKLAKKQYYIKLFGDYRTNTKKLWSTINSLTNKSSSKQKTTTIVHNNKLINEPVALANCFNDFFSSIAVDLDHKLPQPSTDPMQYLSENFDSMPSPVPSINDIVKVIKSLRNKSCSIDDFSPSAIKQNAHLLAQPLKSLFIQSINEGIFPDSLKAANIIPIYKKGMKSDLNNYRPIALLNVFSKIMEKLMKKYIVDHIDLNNIISTSQYGFQKGKSTLDALLKFSELIHKNLDKSNNILSIFIDFSKAFDTVPHTLLLNKLEHYGIRNNLLQWIKSYLTNRTQQVIIDKHKSEPKSTNLGEPQGSVLGPLLFLFYINDLPNISKLFYSILFADDSTLSLTGRDPEQLIALANLEMQKFHLWCTANRLTVNTSKTFYILFSNRHVPDLPPLTIKSNFTYDVIARVENIKFLGVYHDERMNFKAHINLLSQRLSRIAALLYQVRDVMPDFVLKKMYIAHVSSQLNYCNLIWANIFPTHLVPLVKAQKRIVRIITKSEALAHTDPLFNQCKILTVEKLRKLSLGKYCFANINKITNDLNVPHLYFTRHRNRLRPYAHNHSLFERSFIYQGPRIWNEIQDNCPNIINSTSLSLFKNKYKSYLLTHV